MILNARCKTLFSRETRGIFSIEVEILWFIKDFLPGNGQKIAFRNFVLPFDICICVPWFPNCNFRENCHGTKANLRISTLRRVLPETSEGGPTEEKHHHALGVPSKWRFTPSGKVFLLPAGVCKTLNHCQTDARLSLGAVLTPHHLLVVYSVYHFAKRIRYKKRIQFFTCATHFYTID